MGHRAALYTVKVRKRGDRRSVPQLLGDFDEAGTHLATSLEEMFLGFEAGTEDGDKVVRHISTVRQEDDLRVMFQHGESGIAQDILAPDGTLRYHQLPPDTGYVPSGALFRLPRNERVGWLAVHVNNRRGVKGLLDKGLSERFRERYPDWIMELTPFVMGTALERAVEQGLVDKIKLVRLERPEDRAIAATDKWVPSNQVGRLELEITVRGRLQRLKTTLLRDFLRGDGSAFGEIVEFQGLTFDEASVLVELPGGGNHTFNLESPETGHAFSLDLPNLRFDEDGNPTEESLWSALQGTLTTVSS